MGETRTVTKYLCPKCGSAWTRYNIITEEHICRYCGHRWRRTHDQ